MCNHYRMLHPELALAFAKEFAEEREQPAWEVTADAWPEASMPVIYQRDTRTLAAMRWGVRPFYGPPNARPVVNARDDALTSRSIWKASVAQRRCLVPADGFFEWAGPPGAKWEVLFHLPDKRPFFFAGLWSWDPSGGGRGYALVTGKAHPVVAELPHDRTPVILNEADAKAWIGKEPLPEEELARLCHPFAGELIRYDMPRTVRAKTLKPPTAPKVVPPTQPELF